MREEPRSIPATDNRFWAVGIVSQYRSGGRTEARGREGVMRLPQAIRRKLVARRHTALLTAIVGLFAVRPLIGETAAAAIATSLAILVVLLAALLTIRVDDLVGERQTLLAERRRRNFVGWALAAPAVAERLWMVFAPNSRLVLLGTISWLLFFGFVTWCQLRNLLKQRPRPSACRSRSTCSWD